MRTPLSESVNEPRENQSSKRGPSGLATSPGSPAVRPPGQEGKGTGQRDQIILEIHAELEKLLLSDEAFSALRDVLRGLAILPPFLRHERRRKTRSPAFVQALNALFLSGSPAGVRDLRKIRDFIATLRQTLDGAASGVQADRFVRLLQDLAKRRRDPRYWKEYLAYREGKPISEILREMHPECSKLRGWEREQYFRKFYAGIQRLAAQYGRTARSSPLR